MCSLDQIQPGQKAIVRSFTNDELSTRLIDMGCLPGELVTVSRKAPLGCPYIIAVGGSEISIRKQEASAIEVELVA